MADTRKDKRAPVSIKVRFKSATVDEFIERYSMDISRGGIFIKSKNPMPIGTLLKFEFRLKDESRLIQGVGRVVWKREEAEADETSPPGMGIKFIKMDAESRATVETIVSSRGDTGGLFDSGGLSPATTEGSFFGAAAREPVQLPPPEDRTSVRHASEFLAEALAGADAVAAAEARADAEAARRRSEELARQRVGGATMTGLGPVSADSALDAAARAAFAKNEPIELATTLPGVGFNPFDDDSGNTDFEEETRVSQRNSAPAPSPGDTKPDGVAAEVQAEHHRVSSEALASTVLADHGLGRASSPPLQSSGAVSGAPGARLSTAPPSTAVREPAASSKAKVWPFVVGIAAIAAAAAVVFFLQSSGSKTPAPPKSVAASRPRVEPHVEPTAPPEKKVSVPVESEPAGATVLVDGKEVGRTPAEVELPVGRAVDVVVRAIGHGAATQRVTAAESNAPIKVTLTALPYVLDVQSVPEGVRVVAGGKRTKTPGALEFSKLSEQLVLTATLAGFESVRQTVPLEAFEEREGKLRAQVMLTLERRAEDPRPRTPPPSSPPTGSEAAGTTAEGADSPPTAPSEPEAPPATKAPATPPPTKAAPPTEPAPTKAPTGPVAPPVPSNPF